MRTEFGCTLRALRKQLDYNQADVTKLMTAFGCPIAKSSLSRWEQGINMPNPIQFISLCAIYHVKDVTAVFNQNRLPNIYDALNRQGRAKVEEYVQDLIASGRYAIKERVIPFPKRKVALYDLPVSAGTGQFLDSSNYEMIETDDPVAQRANFGVRIAGDSMEPEFHDGGIIWIQQQQELEDGEVGIFFLNGDAYLKMLRRTPKRIELVSFNPEYEPKVVRPDDEFRVFGKVLR